MGERERTRRDNGETVRRLWALFDAGEFAAAGELLADDFVCEWPQSRERIRGRDNYVAVNERYPGRWRIAVRRLIVDDDGDQVATEVFMTNEEDATQHATAVSFFELRDGRIRRQTDYWPEPYDVPAWRAQWVERT